MFVNVSLMIGKRIMMYFVNFILVGLCYVTVMLLLMHFVIFVLVSL